MDKEKYLELIPVKLCDHKINEGKVTVYFKKEKPTLIEKLFFRKLLNKPYKIDLDEIGSFIWHQIDGNRKVKDIVELGTREFGSEIEPADERVSLFMQQMHATKLIELYEKR